MGRAKQSMKLIKEGRIRKITFQKRKEGLKQKARELSVLCDVEVCLIIYSLASEGSTIRELEIWPPDRDIVQSLIDSYKKQSNEDRNKNTDNLSKFLEKRCQNIESDLLNLRKKNLNAKYAIWDDRYNNYSYAQFRDFESLLDVKLANARTGIKAIKSAQNCASSSNVMNDFVLPHYQPEPSSEMAFPMNNYPFHQTHQGHIQERANHPLMMINDSDSYHDSRSQYSGMTSNNFPYIRCSVDTTLGNFLGPRGGYFGSYNSGMLMMPSHKQNVKTDDNSDWFKQLMQNLNRSQM